MECDILHPRMSASLFSFRGFFLPYYRVPTSSVQFLDKPIASPRNILLFVRLNSWSCAVVDVAESSPTSGVVVTNTWNTRYQLLEDNHKRPSISSSPGWFSSLPLHGAGKTAMRRTRGQSAISKRNEKLRLYSEMLRNCSSRKSLNEGKIIHAWVIKCGIEPDLHLWVSLVNLYAKCGSCQSAYLVFDKMPVHDVVSWTSLIAGFVAKGYGSDSIHLFTQMRREGVEPNEFSFAIGLRACSLCCELKFGKQLHAEVIKTGLLSDPYVGSALIDLYAKSGEMEIASRVFFCMPQKNAVLWNTLLNGYAQIDDVEGVLRLFARMAESDIKLSKVTLCTALKGCANSGSLGAGRILHSFAIRIGCELDEVLSCCLVDLYSKCGLSEDSLKVFRRIKDPDLVTWSAMIACLDQQGQSQEAAGLYNSMRHAGLTPNHYTLASVVSVATDIGDLSYGESIHACVFKHGFELYTVVSNALISMYMKIGSVEHGCRVFEASPDLDLVSWNSLLSGFHTDGTRDKGPRIFCQLLLKGFRPNTYTFISILRSCSSLMNISFGKQVHNQIIKNGYDKNNFVGTALIDMYARVKYLEDVKLIFDRLDEKDIFTWTAVISGCVQIDQEEAAIRCLNKMQREGLKPNEFTIASCLGGCSSIAVLGTGQQLHSLAIKVGQLDDVFVGSALVDMYAKCGCIEYAENVFDGLALRDRVSWNTIICGYSQHGMGVEALKSFSLMLHDGIVPDEITFVGVLSACSHMGLIEEGREHFSSINRVYEISPTIEHYTCMVDILGQAGKFDEIESFIMKMELIPDAMIWRTILGACRVHGNVELAEKVAHKLFEVEPKMDSNYILLSNIYASKGRWDDVQEVRSLMSVEGLKKEPGCSWVEVNARVHVFLSQDCSHPMIQKIHLKLEELGKELASVGYIPKTEHVLHDIPEHGKKENLFHHSERLALAFCLISSNSRKTIRIFKNLRICGDCHDVMKFISDVTSREIVVRDVSQFHHFKKGICSCQDYW